MGRGRAAARLRDLLVCDACCAVAPGPLPGRPQIRLPRRRGIMGNSTSTTFRGAPQNGVTRMRHSYRLRVSRRAGHPPPRPRSLQYLNAPTAARWLFGYTDILFLPRRASSSSSAPRRPPPFPASPPLGAVANAGPASRQSGGTISSPSPRCRVCSGADPRVQVPDRCLARTSWAGASRMATRPRVSPTRRRPTALVLPPLGTLTPSPVRGGRILSFAPTGSLDAELSGPATSYSSTPRLIGARRRRPTRYSGPIWHSAPRRYRKARIASRSSSGRDRSSSAWSSAPWG